MEKIQWSFLSDNHLVERVKKRSCEKSLLELSERHSGLYFKILKKYTKSFFANNIDINETAADKNLIIWNSVKSFSTDKNVKFSTWLANQTKYHCLNTLNKKSKDRLITTGDDILDYLNEEEEPSGGTVLFEFIENILSQLKDQRIKKIFSMRYSKEEKKPSWCVVASNLKISTQTAINLHNKGISILRKKITSEKLLDNI
jgi:RNA polymerase sigma factor (sigma-70 family)